MDSSPTDNPYSILGVSPGCSAREIRAAYRKLALQHHPDKAPTPAAAAQAHEQFAKISAAYETLTNTNNNSDSNKQPQSQYDHGPTDPNPYSSSFHDPFAVFDHVFRQEFGNSGRGSSSSPSWWGGFPFSNHHRVPRGSFFDDRDPFDDDFFSSFRGHNSRPPRTSIFDYHSSFFGGHGDLFGGDMFSQMRDQMQQLEREAMQQQQQQQRGSSENHGSGNGNRYYSSSSSSSTRSYQQGNGERVTTTERTQTINGQTEKVTETIVYNRDGSIKERHVKGNDNLLLSSSNNKNDRGTLLPPPSQHAEELHQDPPPSWWRRQRRPPKVPDQSHDDNQNSRL